MLEALLQRRQEWQRDEALIEAEGAFWPQAARDRLDARCKVLRDVSMIVGVKYRLYVQCDR